MFCCTNSVLKFISRLSVYYRPVAEMAWNNPWPYISLSDKRLNCSKNDLWEPQIEFAKSRANVPKACQLLIFTRQRVNKRANAIRRANVPNGVPIFQLGVPTCQKAFQFFKHSSYEMLSEISTLYCYIENSTFYLIS